MAEETVKQKTEETREVRPEDREQEHRNRRSRHGQAVIIDLGRKSAKDVRDLRKGRGRLLDDVEDCLEELREANAVSGTAQPVIIVVERRTNVGNMMPIILPPGIPAVLPMGGMTRDDDDDDDYDD